MPHAIIASPGPADVLDIAFSVPLFSLVAAALLTPLVIVVARLRDARRRPAPATTTDTGPATARYRRERVMVGASAIFVIVAFAFAYVVPGYAWSLVDVVEWWKYATPVFAGCVSIAVVLAVILARGFTRPEQPVLSAAPRSWTSFGPRIGLIAAGLVTVALLWTTVAAGLASSADSNGRFIYLELTVPNAPVDPVRPWFYGWSFGVPVLICVTALIAVTVGALHANAIRPFRRPDTVAAEQAARGAIASGIVRIATAGMLLSLAGAWRFIARAGMISSVGVGDGTVEHSYEMTWRYAEFALAAGWLAPVLEIIAFVLLLLVASRIRPAGSVQPHHEGAEPAPLPEAAR